MVDNSYRFITDSLRTMGDHGLLPVHNKSSRLPFNNESRRKCLGAPSQSVRPSRTQTLGRIDSHLIRTTDKPQKILYH
jgi:hypothetical protein